MLPDASQSAVEHVTSGGFSQLYSFKGVADGKWPQGDLIEAGGVLYGTTGFGSGGSVGSLYELTASGTETTLHRFGGKGNGQVPVGRSDRFDH
jgi:hypothetical protein